MVRQRKSVKISQNNANVDTSSSSGSEGTIVSKKRLQILTGWTTAIGVLFFSIAVYFIVLGYYETRVNTPFDNNQKIVNDLMTGPGVPERFWGTFRPGIYMGLRSREPKSPVFGLMWYEMKSLHNGIRHWCKQEDNLPTYGWLRHNGATFGEQLISDPPFTIHTSFIKNAALSGATQWTVRINVTAPKNMTSPIALIWYAAIDETGNQLRAENGAILGNTAMHRNFKIQLHTVLGEVLNTSQTEAHINGLDEVNDKVVSLLRIKPHPDLGKVSVLTPDDSLNPKNGVNFIPIQMLVQAPFVVDIEYSSEGAPPALKHSLYCGALEHARQVFDSHFEETFNLSSKGYSAEDVSIARAAMSNMIGGIGYFYGTSRVRSQHTKEPVPYWRAALYSAVPSRSFFPRGFLWDEGFHNLLIGRWSVPITMEIVAHWLDLLNVEGWIPREQILGAEALARVPKEFVVQSNAAANPPMLLITLARIVKLHPALFQPEAAHRDTLTTMWPRLQAWYNWFQMTQKGEEPTSYRWRGREDDGKQLNPKSLSSGLDDYPRASHPSEIERHIDLRCWMYAAADALVTIAQVLQVDSNKYEYISAQLSEENLLNELHWSSETQSYADYGLHSEGVKLIRQPSKSPHERPEVVRVVTVPPQPRFVTSAFGYVSLFPMLLKVLHPSSDKLGRILENLDNPDLLWSPYGLRSLSKSSPFYMKRNTEHDPPYWRGQVWININYLALSSLRYYSLENSTYSVRAGQLHDKLRDNVVRTVLSEYKRTGYLWEQYSGTDGKGSGCRPFTGWTSLVVLIMAEEY